MKRRFANIKDGMLTVDGEEYLKFDNSIEAGKFIIRLGYRFVDTVAGRHQFIK